MVKVSDIQDRGSLEKWLLDRPGDEAKTFAITIAHRAAMRVLPAYWHWVETSETARESDLTALLFLRCNLVSGVARKIPTPEIGNAADAAGLAADAVLPDVDEADGANFYDEFYAAVFADNSADDVTAGDAANAAGYAAGAAAANANAAAEAANAASAAAFWREIRSDCDLLENGDMLLATPLWHGNENPLLIVWDTLRKSLLDSSETRIDWSFWIKWYQDALEGREPDWDMLAEIALIPDGDWEKGPEHINNQVIAGIVEKYRLLRDVQALRKELAAVRQTATAAPMGHNNPPEGIEAEAEVVTQTEIIWAALEEAEEELSKPEPSPSVLKRIGNAILGAAKKVMKYSVGLLDIALKSAAKEGGATFGKWGARGVIAWIAMQNPHLVLLGQQLIEYANSLRK